MSDTAPLGNGTTTVSTGDGVMVGVVPAKTPDQIRAEQQARASMFQTDTTGGQPQFQSVEGTPQQSFTAEDIQRARQQEKEKLYPRLEKVDQIEAELAQLRAEREEAQRVAREAQEAAEAERRKAEEENMSAKQLIERAREELQQEIRAEREQRERAEAVLAQERQLSALNEYKNGRVRDAESEILPELLGYVAGNSPEEIDASIEAAKQHTASILQGVAQFQQQQRMAMRGASPSGLPPLGPLETQQETRELSAADIAAMSPAEYARHRGQLLQASSRQFYGQR